ncbi:MAG: UvrD-helicase domain-containing protein, partial [Pseudonocardiaceae bacterium]
MSSRPDDQDARDRVRDSHAETLFVEAGAGTGKTTALVARVVQMVATAHVDAIGRLAAITFTENAAAELRSRIREGLGEAARGSYRGTAFDQIQQARCRAAVATLDDAVITTLHGFASRILAEAPLEAGLAPGFGVGDTMGTGAAAEEGWRDFLDDLMDDHTVRGHLLAGLALGLRLGDLRGVAAALSGSWDRLRVRPLRERVLPVIDASEVLDPLRAALRDDGRWPDDDHLTGHLRGTVTNLATELAALDHPLDLLDALSRADIKCGKGKAPSWRAAGLDKKVVVDALNDAERARTDLLAAVGAAVTETLAARVQDWLLTAADRRRADGELEFHDLLVLARDVLRADPVVRRRLHAQWPVLLIDEFQDTDPLQVEIACLLAGHGDGDPPEEWADIDVAPGRLFFVGDPKQSIYRFRRADVASYTSVGGLHYTRRTGLSVNFRSMPGVLDAVNHTFRTLIGADADAGIPYADLLPSRPADGEGPPVLLLGGPQKDADAAALREVEAAHLADVIVRAKAEGWPVHASGTTRPASYQDMAILLPTRTPLPTLERSLQDRSVPYRVESRSLVWATDAVRDLVTLLQAIDNPADEVALLAALRHPGLACSDVDLVAWRASGGRWSVFATVPDGLDQDHPVAAALATLRGWHDQRWWLPVNHLVEQVVRELRLIELTGAQHRPRDHWRRLRFVVDQARAWCDAGGSGLRGFVTWAAQQIENDADVLETVVPEADDDAVRILTVHGSKGLEFPITMVAGLGGTGRSPSPVLWTGDGPRVRLKARVLEMAGWPDAADEEKVQARREDIRLLYVA